jgi:hypothetical protein
VLQVADGSVYASPEQVFPARYYTGSVGNIHHEFISILTVSSATRMRPAKVGE